MSAHFFVKEATGTANRFFSSETSAMKLLIRSMSLCRCRRGLQGLPHLSSIEILAVLN